MNAAYSRENGKTYRKVSAGQCMDERQMKMFMENKTRNFLAVSEYRINDEAYYKYDVSSMMVMSSEFEDREMNADDIKNVTESLKNAVTEADSYLVEADGIVLDPDYIFSDGNGSWRFMYFADGGGNFDSGLRDMFEYIIRRVCHKDSRASAMAYGIYKRICDGENDFNLLFKFEEKEEIEKPVVLEEHNIIESVIPQPVKEEKEVPDKFKMYAALGIAGIWAMTAIVFLAGLLIPGLRIKGMGTAGCFAVLLVMTVVGYFGFRWYMKNKDMFFRIKTENVQVPYDQGNVRILMPQKQEDEDKSYTVVLNSQPQKITHMLTWEENGCRRNYSLNSEVCIIGSSRDKADCVVNVTGVSRTHARISKEGDKYFVKDLNSTNGTCVNGKALACFEIYEVKSGDVLELGNAKCG